MTGNGNGWGKIVAECSIIGVITLALYVVLAERIVVNRDGLATLDEDLSTEMRELDDNIKATADATNARVDERFAALDNSVLLRLARVEADMDKLRDYMQSLEIRTVKQDPILSHETK